jgi:alpha-aminoadipate carrier protein LysW
MSMNCVDCGGILEIPEDSISGEIISCPDCGLDFVVVEGENGLLMLKELMIEGEDWGE